LSPITHLTHYQVYAQSYKPHDLKPVVQDYNMRRKQIMEEEEAKARVRG